MVLMNKHPRPAHLLSLVLFPFKRPFLFAADLCAQLGVFFQKVYLAFLKAENFFLKREEARFNLR